MSFPKYDLSPSRSDVYRDNARFLVEAYRDGSVSFEDCFSNLEPRVLDGVVTNSEIDEEDSALLITERDLSQIGRSLIDNIPDREPHLDEFFGSPDLFEEYYRSIEWEPELEITDSSQLEHYKIDSPYFEEVEEFDRKSAINKGRELPTFIGWAGGIPAAVINESALLAGGGAGFLLGYTISKARASRYNSRARGIEKKIEDSIYDELSRKHLEEFNDFKVEIQ